MLDQRFFGHLGEKRRLTGSSWCPSRPNRSAHPKKLKGELMSQVVGLTSYSARFC